MLVLTELNPNKFAALLIIAALVFGAAVSNNIECGAAGFTARHCLKGSFCSDEGRLINEYLILYGYFP
jgi:hypothetical protein